jgi:hypothetical protein
LPVNISSQAKNSQSSNLKFTNAINEVAVRHGSKKKEEEEDYFLGVAR